jgi:hypothetical protein
MGWFPKQANGGLAGGKSTALLSGGGTSSNPLSTATAGKNFLGYWLKSSAASGDARGMYMRLYLAGQGSGEAGRFYTTGQAAGVATGGSAHGIHASFDLGTTASHNVSGQAFAGRFTLGAAAATRTLNGNTGALLVESDIAAGNTVPATLALLHFKELGAVACKKAFRFPVVASAGMVAVHTTQVMSHSVRCVLDDGTVIYLMATDTASNRTGGA